MKFSYLIDTDWIIHYLNGNRDVFSKPRSLESEGLTVSVISIAELYEGIYYSTNPDGNKRALEYQNTSTLLPGREIISGHLGQPESELGCYAVLEIDYIKKGE